MAIAEAPRAVVRPDPGTRGLHFERTFTREGVHPYDEIEWEQRDAVIPGEGGNVFEQKGVEVPKSWSQTATNVVASKYFRGKLGTPMRETSVRQMIDRVVDTIAAHGRSEGYFASGQDAAIFADELRWLLANQHASFNSPVWFNIGVPGARQQASACQPYRAKVSTPFGLIPIGEIVKNDLVGLPVYDSSGMTLIQATKHNGRKNVYRVQLANGSFIEATADHLVSARRTRSSAPTWLRVDQLALGMRMRVNTRSAAVLAGRYVPALALAPAPVAVAEPTPTPAGYAVRGEEADAPVELRFAEGDIDVSEAALAGWLQADGFVGQYTEGTNRSLTIEFETATAEERDWIIGHLNVAMPEIHRREYPHAKLPDYRKIRLYGEVVRPFVTKYALLQRGAEIRVPDPVWTAKPEVVRAYLRSVFQADGFVTVRTEENRGWAGSLVAIDVVSKKWLEDIQLLLLSRGIFSTLMNKHETRPNRQALWELRIGFLTERRRFAREVGFVSRVKEEKLLAGLEQEGRSCADERLEEIVSIEPLGEEDVYDIQTLSGEYLSNYVVVHNCFILSVEDSMDSILDWFKNEGVIFKGGSGSGINVSTVRSSREHLSGGGLASGPVSFMRGADSVAGSIKSGGTTRRAAKMVVLNADHPDVREFIWCKAREEKKAWALGEQGYDMGLNGEAWQSIQFQNANNSVRVTDDFMQAALDGREWALRAVTTGETLETVNARDLLREIADAAWQCGDPGMQFDTTCNAWHTRKNSGPNRATNPCAEFVSLDDTACNLASLNLMRFVTADGELDVERLRASVDVVLTAQEILVGYSQYPTEKITKNARANREIGLGYANLGALLMSRGLPYDSDEGRSYAAAITAVMTGEAYAQSARIAAVTGPYDNYRTNKDPHDAVMSMHRDAAHRIPERLVPADLHAAARGVWDEVISLGQEHGYRNAQATVAAPTGTISFMMDCDTTGVEPDIALVKYKKLVGGGMLKLINNTVPTALRRLGYTQTEAGEITSYIERTGTIEGAPGLREQHLPVFDCAFTPSNGTRSIHHMGHIKMLGAVQPLISGSVSKTVNLPETATVDDVMDAYVQAWKHGVKAIAIYRDGSKKVQPLSTSSDSSNSKKDAAPLVGNGGVASGHTAIAPSTSGNGAAIEVPTHVVARSRRKLPDTRHSLTHKFSIEGHEGYITVGLFEDGTPGELFITMAKEGSTLSGMVDAFATSVSLLFQYGVPLSHLVEKFGHMRFEPSGWTGNPEIGFAKSIVDYVFRWLGHRFLSADERAMLGLVRTTEVADATPQLELLNKVVPPASDLEHAGTPQSAAPMRRMNSTPDAPPCPRCGWLTVRNGTCHKCENCGETTGCS